MVGRIEFAVVADEGGDIAVDLEVFDSRPADPGGNLLGPSDHAQKGVGRVIVRPGDHLLDQVDGLQPRTVAHRGDTAGERRRTNRHEQRKFVVQAPAPLLDPFQKRGGNRDLAGAGHGETLIAQDGDMFARGQIHGGDADAPLRPFRNLGYALPQGTAIDCLVGLRLAGFATQHGVELRLERVRTILGNSLRRQRQRESRGQNSRGFFQCHSPEDTPFMVFRTLT